MGLFTKNIKKAYSNDNPTESKDIPGWLKMLQDNSWELEIIISGGAIFSLFELSGLTTDFFYTLAYTNHFVGRNILFMFCMLAIKGLTLGFFLHIVLRSFWVSLISLSSMYRNADSSKKIKLAEPFKSIEGRSLSQFIIQVDKLSAWMMYNTFTIVFVIVGFLLLFFIILSLRIFFETYLPINLGWFFIIT